MRPGVAGWGHAALVLTSLVPGYAEAERSEESNSWRHPVDLVEILDRAFEELPKALQAGRGRRNGPERGGSAREGQPATWAGRANLVPVLLGEDAQAIADAQFPTSNEFGDWDTALHTFTFANAVQQGLARSPSVDLLRGVFDAAMSVYLDRFLNVPPVRLPEPNGASRDRAAAGHRGGEMLNELTALLDRQQQVNEAGRLVADYLYGGGDPDRLIAALGRALLREDRNFHTIQMIEAAVRQFGGLRGSPDGVPVLVAAARYLAAHAPTMRAQGQTYRIAQRLQRGEKLFEDE